MVFRFTEDNDKELMREVIAQKPFAAKYGETARVWANVATKVSTAIKEVVLEKQVRDRVRILKKNWRTGELRSSLGSGIEEALDAVNEQSHYETLSGLVGQYVLLERTFKDEKTERIAKKKLDEASATRCASEIVAEATVRRALRAEYESVGGSSDSDNVSDTASTRSTPAKAQRPKRKSAFQIESERQDKRMRDDMEIRRDHFMQQMQVQQKQHEDRIAFEREMQEQRTQMEQARTAAQDRLEERLHSARQESEERNRQLIYECVKVLSEAFSKPNKG